MAMLYAAVHRSPAEVWAVLADGWSYVEWVVGTTEIIEVDPEWPAVGSSLCFRVGWGRLSFVDRTFVRSMEPERLLELEAHALPMGTARVGIEIKDWGDKTLLLLDEHPVTGPGQRLHSAAVDVLLRLRLRRMMDHLIKVVEERSPERMQQPT